MVSELFQKLYQLIYATHFMTSKIIPLPFVLFFYIWKVWKGRGKIQKFEYLENERSFLDEIKSIFHSF